MKTTLSVHLRHDASLSIAQGNKIVLYVELEKITKQRYFSFSEDINIFRVQCLDYLLPYLNDWFIDEIILNWVTADQEKTLRDIFPNIKEWNTSNHHIAHAWSSYVFTEPQETDLILSYDGGGDLNDFFYIFKYKDGEINTIKNVPINLGRPYRLLGLLSPELYKKQDEGYSLEHALAGKIMALVALGNVIESYKEPLLRFYLDFENHSVEENFNNLLCAIGNKDQKFLSLEKARDVLATSQRVFEEIVENNFFPYILEHKPNRIIICGGCALNVTMNSKISERFNIPIFISPCPNDCGISLGTLKMFNKNINILPKPFSEISPKNEYNKDKDGQNLEHKVFDIKFLAELLATGKVIGTIRGDLEIGPRALGNRSYLASPIIDGMKDKINQMKGREFWRPVAPIILEEDFYDYFATNQNSPYMSFAPKVKPQFKLVLKEILHLDDTARVQTVSKKDGWIYELLCELKKITGYGIVMNTSFNRKGEPLINDIKDAIDILKTTELDGVVIDNMIVLK
jgi:carbamoyltransferase